MNIAVVTPLLLWLLSNNCVKPTTLAKANCLRALESYLVRRVVCGYGAKSYGNFFVALIEKLAASPTDSIDRALVSNLAAQTGQTTLWPNDMELQDRFVTASLYQWLTRGRLRMLLAGIEGQLRTQMAETQEVPGNLHIEHIMPQKWSANWPLPMGGNGDAVANRERAIHTMGNLTLVNNRLNTALSNAPWHEKRGTLADHSVLYLNKHLVNDGPQAWTEDAIEGRGKWLYRIAGLKLRSRIGSWPKTFSKSKVGAAGGTAYLRKQARMAYVLILTYVLLFSVSRSMRKMPATRRVACFPD